MNNQFINWPSEGKFLREVANQVAKALEENGTTRTQRLRRVIKRLETRAEKFLPKNAA